MARCRQISIAKTNDRIIFFSENGFFYSILGNKLPSGRGFGEPLSKFFDLDNNEKIVNFFNYFDGKVAIARVYDKVLTDEEIKQNFDALRTRFGL